MFLFGPPDIAKLKAKKDLKGLINALNYKDAYIRADAVEALGELGDPKSYDPLIHALSDSDSDVRKRVVLAVASLGDKKAFEPLLFMLKDSEYDVQSNAILSLGKLRDERAVDILTEYIDGEFHIIAAAEALSEIGAHTTEPEILSKIIKKILPLAAHPGYGLRIENAIIQIGDNAVEPLIAEGQISILAKIAEQSKNPVVIEKIAHFILSSFDKANIDYYHLVRRIAAVEHLLPQLTDSPLYHDLVNKVFSVVNDISIPVFLKINPEDRMSVSHAEWKPISDILLSIKDDRASELRNKIADIMFEKGKSISSKHHPDQHYDREIRENEIRLYEIALGFDPNHVRCLTNKAITHCEMKDWENALEAFDKALAIDSKFEKAIVSRWIPLWNLRKFSEALESLDIAIRYDPDLVQTKKDLEVRLKKS